CCPPSPNEASMPDYQKLAGYLRGLKADPAAQAFYDLFADALVWSDELPHPDSEVVEDFRPAELRGVWRYRTLLILGQPGERFRNAWEEAMKCFPTWPGFAQERRDLALADTFNRLRETAMRKWEEDDARYEAAIAKQQQASA